MADTASEPRNRTLTWFNGLTIDAAQQHLLPCCGAREWAAIVAAGRPYAGLDDLLKTSDAALAALTEDDIAEALAEHPRIGERAGGPEGAWSRREQSGAARAEQAVQDALAEGNAAYEQRFDWVFLICATGLSGEQMLAALHDRLDNDPDDERLVVREELRKITQLRLRKLVETS